MSTFLPIIFQGDCICRAYNDFSMYPHIAYTIVLDAKCNYNCSRNELAVLISKYYYSTIAEYKCEKSPSQFTQYPGHQRIQYIEQHLKM